MTVDREIECSRSGSRRSRTASCKYGREGQAVRVHGAVMKYIHTKDLISRFDGLVWRG